MSYVGQCEICGETVDSSQRAAFPVKGWEIQRSQGGANQIFGKVREPNRVAHAYCVEHRHRRGDQGTLGL